MNVPIHVNTDYKTVPKLSEAAMAVYIVYGSILTQREAQKRLI